MDSPPPILTKNMASIRLKFTYTIITIFISLSFFSLKLACADDSASTCEYPCQPPPTTDCPPPPPASNTPVYSYPPPASDTPVNNYPPPSPSGVSGYWNPPPPPFSGNNPYFSPPNSNHNYNSPPPPNPILPWFPWYYYSNKTPASSEGCSVFSNGLSRGSVVFMVVFAVLIVFN